MTRVELVAQGWWWELNECFESSFITHVPFQFCFIVWSFYFGWPQGYNSCVLYSHAPYVENGFCTYPYMYVCGVFFWGGVFLD